MARTIRAPARATQRPTVTAWVNWSRVSSGSRLAIIGHLAISVPVLTRCTPMRGARRVVGPTPRLASLPLRRTRVHGVGEALPQETPSRALIHQKQVCGRAAINGEAVLRSQHLSIVDSLGAFGSR